MYEFISELSTVQKIAIATFPIWGGVLSGTIVECLSFSVKRMRSNKLIEVKVNG